MVVMVVTAVTMQAQITMNVRVGGGISNVTGVRHERVIDVAPTVAFAFQTNIPVTFGSSYTFSPSLLCTVCPGKKGSDPLTRRKGSFGILSLLQAGKKISITNRTLFFPKFGAAVGYQNDGLRIGPSLELAVETGHFVVSLDGYYSLRKEGCDYRSSNGYEDDYNPYAASLTLGYKF